MNVALSRSLALALGIALAGFAGSALAGPDPTTWRGTLQDGAAAAGGRYDIQVRLHASRDSNKALAEPIEFAAVDVRNGQFELPLALPPWLQSTPELWLELAVRAAGAKDFETLPQRALAKGGGSACWSIDGNAGNPIGSFLGTVDTQGLVLRSNNRRVAFYGYFGNQVESPFVMVGSEFNLAVATGAVISGGGRQGSENFAFGNYSTISGGRGNRTGQNNSNFANSTVAGGVNNRAIATDSAIGGGSNNQATGQRSVVSGGSNNIAEGVASVIGGGENNSSQGLRTVIAGGDQNIALGDSAVVSGGQLNQATGGGSVVPGGQNNRATNVFTFAAGNNARAVHPSSFVWSDGQGGTFSSTRANQVRFRAEGGLHLQGGSNLGVNAAALGNADPVELVLEAADAQAYLMSDNVGTFGSVVALGEMNNNALVNTWAIARETSGGGNGLRFAFGTNANASVNTVRVKFNSNGTVFKSAGTATWDVVSDARLKTELGPIDNALDRLLQLRGVRFQYRTDQRPHGMELPAGEQIGFMAQEVQQVFPEWVSAADDGLLSIGERGTTALLVEALRELDARNAVLAADNAVLEARLAVLERALLGR